MKDQKEETNAARHRLYQQGHRARYQLRELEREWKIKSRTELSLLARYHHEVTRLVRSAVNTYDYERTLERWEVGELADEAFRHLSEAAGLSTETLRQGYEAEARSTGQPETPEQLVALVITRELWKLSRRTAQMYKIGAKLISESKIELV
jgi:hypothetical protein